MSEVWQFKLGEFMLTTRCDFLSMSELEAWVDGALNRDRVESWEHHRGGCAACVELYEDANSFQQLVASPLTVASELRAFRASDPRVRRRVGLDSSRKRRKAWSWSWFFVPASFLAALLVAMIWIGGGRPIERLLGDVDPLAFVAPPVVRGTLSDAWDQAETAWERGDYEQVAQSLGAAWKEDSTAPDLGLYLAYAQLQIDRPAAASRTLERVEELEGQQPSEWTLWLGAHAQDRVGNREATCEKLERLIALDGDRRELAQDAFDEGCR